jgi:hypothetical protein
VIDSSFGDGSELDRITKVTNSFDGSCSKLDNGQGAGDLTPSDTKKEVTYSSGEVDRLLKLYAAGAEDSARREYQALRIRRDKRSFRQAKLEIARRWGIYISILAGSGLAVGAGVALMCKLFLQVVMAAQ